MQFAPALRDGYFLSGRIPRIASAPADSFRGYSRASLREEMQFSTNENVQ